MNNNPQIQMTLYAADLLASFTDVCSLLHNAHAQTNFLKHLNVCSKNNGRKLAVGAKFDFLKFPPKSATAYTTNN